MPVLRERAAWSAASGECATAAAFVPTDQSLRVWITRSALAVLLVLTSLFILTDGATAQPTPTVTSLSPSNGSSVGGAQIIVFGTLFTGATAVKFGNTAAASFNVSSDGTAIFAISPAGTGTVDVTVTTPAGTSAASAASKFTYSAAAPTVASLSPNNASSTGGAQIIIFGTLFTGATAVKFGSTAATSFNVSSDGTAIFAISPAGTGTVDVTVTTPAGTSAASAVSKFTYPATPTVVGISPNSGPAAGGTSVTITGTNFTVGTPVFVYFGALLAQFAIVNSPTSITATSPTGTPDALIDLKVNQGNATSATSAADQLTYTK